MDGDCIDANDGTFCPLKGCKVATGAAYCTECLLGYSLVDGTCIRFNIDSTTADRCKTVTNGECSECSPEYYLDVKDSYGTTQRNTCIYIDDPTGCLTFVAGRCTVCQKSGQVVINGKCGWPRDETPGGGIPGCATYSGDVCETAYLNVFLSTDKKSAKIISDVCGGYDGDFNCVKVNHIKGILAFDYPTGLWKGIVNNNGGGYCEKSYDYGCTCTACKNTWTLSGSKTCPSNLDGSGNAIDPNTVIRGCIKFASTTTCDTCRSPDFLKTTDSLCYDLNF